METGRRIAEHACFERAADARDSGVGQSVEEEPECPGVGDEEVVRGEESDTGTAGERGVNMTGDEVDPGPLDEADQQVDSVEIIADEAAQQLKLEMPVR